MPNWKKVITSGSDAAFNTVIASNGFTGSLQGTGSWAINAVTASYVTGSIFDSANLVLSASFAINSISSSYILSSNVSGPSGFDSVSYATSAGSAGTADQLNSPVTQDLELRGQLTRVVNFTNYETIAQSSYLYYGEVVIGTTANSGGTLGQVVFLDSTGQWESVSDANSSATKLLGVYAGDVGDGSLYILLDGTITLPLSSLYHNIGQAQPGRPIYLKGSGGYTTDPAYLTNAYQRLLGYILAIDPVDSDKFVLKFRPSNDWTEL